MHYKKIDFSTWHRQEHFCIYRKIDCQFSLTIELDVSNVVAFYKAKNYKFYPVMIHLISQAVNELSAFKMFWKDDALIEWDQVHPAYTVFHPEIETFSSLWTEYHASLSNFMEAFTDDALQYQKNTTLSAKPNLPDNHFNISSLPWISFKGFNLKFSEVKDYFAPIFTIGKFYEIDGKVLLSIAVQVHHAVCDGFHVAKLLKILQDKCDELNL